MRNKTWPLAILLMVWAFQVSAIDSDSKDAALSKHSLNVLAQLPITFEQNRGQFDSKVDYVARGNGFAIGLTGQEMRIALRSKVKISSANFDQAQILIRFLGAEKKISASGLEKTEQISNYFRGGETTDHLTDVPHYLRLKYENIYSGIDLVYYGNGHELEHDFIVNPGADPKKIRMTYSGARVVIRDGQLVLSAAGNQLIFRKPIAFQESEAGRVNVDVAFQVLSKNQIGFRLAQYDQSKPLIIDPILAYSTYLSGTNGSTAQGIAVDQAGNMYVTGYTSSTDFPVLGAYKSSKSGTQEAFITKIRADGAGLLYSTYLGSSQRNNGAYIYAYGIAIDSVGNAIVVGDPGTASFPVTTGAYQVTKTGSPVSFITKLNATGNALLFSTYLNNSAVRAVALDGAANVYLTGTAKSGFITTQGAYQTANRNITTPFETGFVAKLNANGAALGYATFLGGTSTDTPRALVVDALGNAYVTGTATSPDFPTVAPYKAALTGTEAFVSKLNSSGSALSYSTFFGGSGNEDGNAIAIDQFGAIYITGHTNSSDLPVINAFQRNIAYQGGGIYNAFITKFVPDGSSLVYSTYLGGRGCLGSGVNSCSGDAIAETGTSIAVNSAGEAFIAGISRSRSFPAWNFVQLALGDGYATTTFFAKLFPDGQRAYVSILGVPAADATSYFLHPSIAAGQNGDAYIANATSAIDFPTTRGAFQPASKLLANASGKQAVVFKISTSGAPPTIVYAGWLDSQGQTVYGFSARVHTQVPNGTVTLKIGSIVLDTKPVVNGLALFPITFLPGVYKITATNNADGKVSAPYLYTERLP